MNFYLGAHHPDWLARAGVPLFVSRRSLEGRRTLPRAIAPWALDSGGFTELSLHGTWTLSPRDYVAQVRSVGRARGFEIDQVYLDGKVWDGELTRAEEDRAQEALQEALEARYDV